MIKTTDEQKIRRDLYKVYIDEAELQRIIRDKVQEHLAAEGVILPEGGLQFVPGHISIEILQGERDGLKISEWRAYASVSIPRGEK